MVCMVGFFNKDDEGGNYGTAEKEGDTSAGNTRTDEQTSKLIKRNVLFLVVLIGPFVL